MPFFKKWKTSRKNSCSQVFKNGETLLMQAIATNNQKLFNTLMKKDLNLDEKDYDGHTALIHAIENYNDEALMKLLAREDVDPNVLIEEQRTPLIHAFLVCNFNAIKILMKCERVDLKLKNEFGDTAYDHAVSAGRKEILDLFPASARPVFFKKSGNRSTVHLDYHDEREHGVRPRIRPQSMGSGPGSDPSGGFVDERLFHFT